MTDVDTQNDDSSHNVQRRGMRPGTKLAAFALVLGAAFGLGAAVGAVAGPIEVTDPEPVHGTDVDHGDEGPGPTTTVVPTGHGDDHGGPTDG